MEGLRVTLWGSAQSKTARTGHLILLDSLVVLDGLGGDRGGDFGGIGYLGVRGSRSNGTGGFAGSECQSHSYCYEYAG